MKTPVQRRSAAATSGRRTTCAKCGEPISSSPSATSTRFTGGFSPAPRMACSAARNAASGPFCAAAHDDLAQPGLVDDGGLPGRRRPLGGIDLLDVVHEVEAGGARLARA